MEKRENLSELPIKKPFLGCAYYPEDWDDGQLVHDVEMMLRAGVTCARIGEFAWRKMEPEPGRFEFGWLHRVVDALAEAGIRVVMGTPTATPPVWLGAAHPEVFMRRPDGTRAQHGGRRHCCANVPSYREACDAIVRALGREFGRDANVIGWQLDNEIYSGGVGCTCEYCVKAFHDRLEREYGSVENLNERWDLNLFSQAYDSFDQVPGDWNAWHNPHLKYEWAGAHYESDIAFIHRQADILRQYTDAPIGTDMMPVNGMGYEAMCGGLDVVMFNHYNTRDNVSAEVFWFDHLRTLKDRPFWNTETSATWNGNTEIGMVLQPEGFCRVNSWLPVALGGECCMYWLWRQHRAGHELMHGSLLSPEGRPTHTFAEIRRTSEEFERASELIAQTKVRTPVALHFTSRAWQLFEQQRFVKDNSYQANVIGVHESLVRCGTRPDVIGALHPLDGYRLLVSPCLMTLEDGDLAERIRCFVENGGVWVAGPMTDVRDGIGAHYVDRAMGMMESWLGVRLEYSVPTDGTVLKTAWANGDELRVRAWAELCDPGDGDSLASVVGGHSALVGKTVISRHKAGKGEVILCGALLDAPELDRLLCAALSDAGVDTFRAEGTLQVSPRYGDAGECTVLCETGGAPASLTVDSPVTDILTEESFSETVPVAPYGVRVLAKTPPLRGC
ncbi:MAG: beta-galactosidase [Clostridia bacterium]|nr:beta-galactosidase [Clostridia bacterium]